MARIVQEICVDVAVAGHCASVAAKQGDINSRFLKISICEDGDPISVENDAVVTMGVCRADGSEVLLSGEVNDDGTVTVPLASCVLEKSGVAECEVSVVDSEGRRLTAFLFKLEIQRAVCGEKVITDDENYSLLVGLISACADIKKDGENAANEAYEAAEKAEVAEKWTISAGIGASEAAENANNAAESATSASSNANNAAESATSAASNANNAAETAYAAAYNANTAANETNVAIDKANTATATANTAASGADNAAAKANAAADRLPEVVSAGNITYDNQASGLAAVNIKSAIDELAEKTGVVAKIAATSWSGVRDLVRAGLAPQAFSIGDRLSCSHSEFGELEWEVIGFDHDTPSDKSLSHSMTLQLVTPLKSHMDWDAPEATWYIDEETFPNGLAAGTYKFVMPSDSMDFANPNNYKGGGQTYQFTLTKAVPVGGQLRFTWQFYASPQPDGSKIISFSSIGGAEIERVSISLGSDGTALPNPGGNSVSETVNTVYRSGAGSSNWRESAIRQWLNSEGGANAWWSPTTVLDRPPKYASSAAFLHGLDPEFAACLGAVDKITLTMSRRDFENDVDIYRLDETSDKMFLLSCAEVFGGAYRANAPADGEPYEYYGLGRSDLSAPAVYSGDSNRLKYVNGSKVNWWLRTASCWSHALKCGYYSGSLGLCALNDAPGAGHYEKCWVFPACCIV